MQQPEPKEIAYLFGAGATHAELDYLYRDRDLPEKLKLLTSQVSDRVIKKAQSSARYLKGLEMLSQVSGMQNIEPPVPGSLNIELLLSLIESSKIHGWEYKTRYIKRLVKQDITGILTRSRTARFHLPKPENKRQGDR